MTEQLTLKLVLSDDATFDNFYCANKNQTIIKCLLELVNDSIKEFIYLWGENGAGLSHLLQACCHAVKKKNKSVSYIEFSTDNDLTPEIFAELEHCKLICLDNIDNIIGIPEWETALFHFYNRAKLQNAQVLMSSKIAPVNLKCHLPDLKSRLLSTLSFNVIGLNDEQKLLALQNRARNRGLKLPTNAARFLLNHYPRNMSILFEALLTLDHASLVSKRRITIPFIKSVLSL